jgi:antitoxin component YwqK of YwqJK toxin-antitoxin module
VNLIDGKKQGLYIEFYESGKKKYELNFVDGK